MHLKSLELTGFKSFAEMKIEFPRGITAVVGPNGSGKSNVLDAILWVLGEQSTKTLRSERMEDVIFNGTQTRKPLGMAEVSLVLAGLNHQNLDGLPGLPENLREFHEVMLTRRLYRNGESEYLINKTACRLKDLRSLLLETRAGTKGHTIIEQGRIAEILNASPQDRRELIEETAGIVRYKKQKAEALRKLDATQQNLLRVRDIIAEVHRQLKSLERQARQARTYQELQQEARHLEVRLLVRDYRALSLLWEQVEAELTQVEAREAEQLAAQGRLAQRLEELKLGVSSTEGNVSRLRDDLTALESQQAQALTAIEVSRGRIELFEQQRLQALNEQARLEQERGGISAQIDTLEQRRMAIEADIAARQQALVKVEETVRTQAAQRTEVAEQEAAARRGLMDLTVQVTQEQNAVGSLQDRQDELCRRVERLDGERQHLEQEREDLLGRLRRTVDVRQQTEHRLTERRQGREQALSDSRGLEERLRQIDQRIARGQESLAGVESKLDALQGVLREEMGYGRRGEEATTSLRAACEGIDQALAEWLSVQPGYERAFEAVLGERLRAWLVDRPGRAQSGIDFLKAKGLGRGTFVPMRPRRAETQETVSWWADMAARPGVVGRARDLAEVAENEEAEALFSSLFERVVIVETLAHALQLWEQGSWSGASGPVLVTLDGEVVDATGIVTGGSGQDSKGPLQRRREIAQLEQERQALHQSLDQDRLQRERYVAEQRATAAAIRQLELEIREAEGELLSLAKEEAAFAPTLQALAQRLAVVANERQRAEEDGAHTRVELEERRGRLERLRLERAQREATVLELQQALTRLDETMQAQQGQMLEARLALTRARSEREHAESDLSRLQTERANHDARTEALAHELTQLLAALDRAAVEQATNERLFRELDERARQVKAELTSAQEAQAQDIARWRAAERELEEVRGALNVSRDERMRVEVRRAELKTQVATLESTLAGTYQLTVPQAFEQQPDPPPVLLTETGTAGENEPPAGDEAVALRARLQKIRERLDRMGPINLAAIDEHRELEERYHFLTTQQEDLTNSIASLKEIISRINRTTKQMFLDTFHELQQKFSEVFGRFFPGGRAELVLVDLEEATKTEAVATDQSPAGEGANGSANGHGNGETGARDVGGHEPGVDIVAQPPGKRLKSISMLSGGEKTLTAMALIFASFLIRPTPFCILDEIDAPLDEQNIGRFTAVLKDLAEQAQFIVITHNKHTMAVADSLFGVTMEEPGVSKLVSVRLADLQPA